MLSAILSFIGGLFWDSEDNSTVDLDKREINSEENAKSNWI